MASLSYPSIRIAIDKKKLGDMIVTLDNFKSLLDFHNQEKFHYKLRYPILLNCLN